MELIGQLLSISQSLNFSCFGEAIRISIPSQALHAIDC
jgi:hypothetical protein